jgi:DNA-binding response OmpR family regulator
VGVGTQFIFRIPVATSLDVNDSEKTREIDDAQRSITLEFYRNDPVVVIEDESSMQEQWRMLTRDHGIEILICGNWEAFEQSGITATLTKNAIVDFHFKDSLINGLTIVRRLKERGFEKVYLCTAEYWRPSLQAEALRLKVPICPKPLLRVEFKMVESPDSAVSCQNILSPKEPVLEDGAAQTANAPFSGENKMRVCVIDDEAMIRNAWEFSKGGLKIDELYTFPNLEALMETQLNLSQMDLIFVDKNIDHSKFSGSQVVKYLKEREVQKIIVASGDDESVIREDPYLARADFIIAEKIPASLQIF